MNIDCTEDPIATKPPKISYCCTCKNRLWQLRDTLPVNFEKIKADGNSEIVLVNFNSEDGLDEWIRQFKKEISNGILCYVHEQSAQYYHCSKAKNLAHFAAGGEYVINLDADNFIGDTIPRYRALWNEGPDSLIQGFCGDFSDGTYGRIGLSARNFRALGGYDEDLLPIGHQDRDLISRAKAYGLKFIRVAQDGIPAIKNGVDEKMKYLGVSLTHRQIVEINSARIAESISLGRLIANLNRKPARVLVNFLTEVYL